MTSDSICAVAQTAFASLATRPGDVVPEQVYVLRIRDRYVVYGCCLRSGERMLAAVFDEDFRLLRQLQM